MERYVFLALGVSLRVLLFHCGPVSLTVPHLTTPYTSGERLFEGWTYYEAGLSPHFEGSPVHTHPALLWLLYCVKDWPHALEAIWIVLDVAIYLFLRRSFSVCSIQPSAATVLFWLNPLTVLNCCSFSTSSIHCFLILSFLAAVNGKVRPFAALTGAALLAINPTYGPVLAVWYYRHRSLRVYADMLVVYAPLAYYGGVGWSLLLSTEIRPNLGLTWYLVTEMFLKYALFYRALLALHPWVYIYPIFAILDKHRKYTNYAHSAGLFAALLASACFLCSPAPILPELFVWAVLFTPHWKLISASPSRFFTVRCRQLNGIWIGLILSYLMWVMWTARLGGNANFFFFQSMLYNGMAFGFVVGLLNEVKKETTKRKATLLVRKVIEDLVAEVSK